MKQALFFILGTLFITRLAAQEITYHYLRFSLENDRGSEIYCFSYPELSELQNAEVQDSLNQILRAPLSAFEQQYQADLQLGKIRVEWRHNCQEMDLDDLYESHVGKDLLINTISMSAEIVQDVYLNITGETSMEGNVAAHPNFSQHKRVYDLRNGELVKFGDISYPELITSLREHPAKYLSLSEPDINCNGENVLQAWVDGLSPDSPIAAMAEKHFYLTTDTRAFSCPEVMREIMELKLSR